MKRSLGIQLVAFTMMAAMAGSLFAQDDVPEFKGKIAEKYEDSVEYWAPKQRPPEGAPNVIIFLLDDTGFAQIGSFGGLIKTPNIDKLAANGLRRVLRQTVIFCWRGGSSLSTPAGDFGVPRLSFHLPLLLPSLEVRR